MPSWNWRSASGPAPLVTGVGEHLGVPTVPDGQDGRPVGADDPRRGEGQPGQQRQVDRLGGDGGEDP